MNDKAMEVVELLFKFDANGVPVYSKTEGEDFLAFFTLLVSEGRSDLSNMNPLLKTNLAQFAVRAGHLNEKGEPQGTIAEAAVRYFEKHPLNPDLVRGLETVLQN